MPTPKEQRARKVFEALLAKVEAALKSEGKHFGFRIEPPDYGIHDGAAYNLVDLDKRPDFVKRDDESF